MWKGLILLCAAMLIGTAHASPRQKHPRHDSQTARTCDLTNYGREICRGAETRTTARLIVTDANGNDPRPAAWCGYWLRHELGVRDRLYNLARAWARYGTPAHGPAVGTIVVWRHHVGLVTGRKDGRWVVKSGNDGGRVRERPRSLAGAIAFRWPNGVASND